MKRFQLLVLLIFSMSIFAQTGIGTTTPNPSAKLDVFSTDKGFLPPRVTLTSGTDIITIPSPATGLLVYNTGNNVGLVAGLLLEWNELGNNSNINWIGCKLLLYARITIQCSNYGT